MVDDKENREQRQTGAEAPADQLFDRQQRFSARRFAHPGFGIEVPSNQDASGGLTLAKKSHE